MTTRSIVAIGIGQCVNWGVLYYAFGVLLTPLERDLGVPGWILASAFSVALLTSALAGPTVGRWIDRGAGLQLVVLGGYIAPILLLVWSAVPGLASLFLVWAALGLCMAATLYEPIFVIIGRVVCTPTARLRALATVTVFGGLASTVFLPATAFLVESWGWRRAVAVLAITLAASTFACSRFYRREVEASETLLPRAATPPVVRERRLLPILGLFAAASLTTTAFTTTLVPALVAQELTPVTAAWLGALLGLMQLPGRVLVMHGALRTSASRLLVVSLALQAVGIGILAVAMSGAPWWPATGITAFAIGAGLMTLARPHLVQTIFAVEHVGYLNGRVASAQNVARAGGPVLAVGLAGVIGYGATFGLLAAVVAAIALVCPLVIDM
jgi:MFS family permease